MAWRELAQIHRVQTGLAAAKGNGYSDKGKQHLVGEMDKTRILL